jgi:HlyD family secretion protein
MTATVTVVTARRENVLVAPNAALRFRPANAPAPSAGRSGRSGGSGAPSGSAAPGASAWSRRGDGAGPDAGDRPERKLAYRLEGNTPVAVRLEVGVTDGSYTELLGDTLREGEQLIVEGPPAEGGSATPNPLGGGQRPPGGGSRVRGMF